MIYQKYVKRLLDIGLSSAGIVVLSPVLLGLSAAIKADSKGPVLFKQKRIGQNKKYFNILKYRSMAMDTPKDIPTHKLTNPDQFITKMGHFLRKTSLDELPQLFNILLGDMSVVGPRPALWNQEDLITERDTYGINTVRPGLTGLAQISGRDELEIPVKVQYDRQYVEHITFMNDAVIVLKTMLSVLKNDGVQEGGTSAMGIKEELM
jgi:O-antigen biosynthesis protein WbqP